MPAIQSYPGQYPEPTPPPLIRSTVPVQFPTGAVDILDLPAFLRYQLLQMIAGQPYKDDNPNVYGAAAARKILAGQMPTHSQLEDHLRHSADVYLAFYPQANTSASGVYPTPAYSAAMEARVGIEFYLKMLYHQHELMDGSGTPKPATMTPAPADYIKPKPWSGPGADQSHVNTTPSPVFDRTAILGSFAFTENGLDYYNVGMGAWKLPVGTTKDIEGNRYKLVSEARPMPGVLYWVTPSA